MQFSDVFREERYYCNHLFRLLCHDKETGGSKSGLGAVLSALGLTENFTRADIHDSQIYTEVAIFRDVFVASRDKDKFVDGLFELFLPMISSQYEGKVSEVLHPSVLRTRLGLIHPRKYADELGKLHPREQDTLFYREFSALFNAKPDFLIVVRDKMIWIEAKFWASFASSQLRRTRNIANICRSPLMQEYFHLSDPVIVLLGLNKKHSKSSLTESARFLSWEQCLTIAEDILPGGRDNYTAASLARMMEFN